MAQTNLNQTFNIQIADQPLEGELITKEGQVVVTTDPDLDKNVMYDYEKTRGNLHSLLSQGEDALFHALDVAKQSEHPRAFEVVGNLIKQLADINHQLMDLSDKRQKIKNASKEPEAPTSVTNNAIFVGSTMELNKMLKDIGGNK
tara:strand:+ start:37 stop:471 length:435 start_codon:yes stop_codon:yes gene_type:complete